MKRYRSRSTVLPREATGLSEQWFGGGSTFWSRTASGIPGSIGLESSYIEDEDDTGYGFKEVDHSKSIMPPTPVVRYISPNAPVWRYDGPKCIPHYRYLNVDDSTIKYAIQWLPPSGFDGTVSLRQVPDRLGEIPSKLVKAMTAFSGDVSAYEAREFPQLLQTMRDQKRLYEWLLRNWREYPSYLFRGREGYLRLLALLRKLGRGSKDAALAYQFGILPTINDCRTLAKEIAKGGSVRRSFTAAIRQTVADPSEESSITVNQLSYKHVKRTESLYVWGGKATLTRSYSDPDGFFAKADNYLRKYVGPSGLMFLYEVCPWSFVVDWFFHLDRAMATNFLNNNPDWDCSYWSSQKHSNRSTYSGEYISGVSPKKPYFDNTFGDFDEVFDRTVATVAWERRATRYIRVRRDPPSSLSSVSFTPNIGAFKGFLFGLLTLGRLL